MAYATARQISSARAKLGSRPFSINDGDGNILEGHVVTEGRAPAGFDMASKTQSIPYGTTPGQIAAHVEAGDLAKAIFAKGMDVRVPSAMVEAINERVDRQDLFSFAILTSRPEGEILKILAESGVGQPGMVTMVADSGAILRLGGKRTVIRALTGEEQDVIDGVRNDEGRLNGLVWQQATKLGFEGTPPGLIVQEKAIGLNFDYRPLLGHFGQGDGSALDQAVGATLKRYLHAAATEGPLDAQTGKLALGVLDGPANVELKVLSVNKKIGLEALLQAAMASPSPPTGFAFSGDDLAKTVKGVAEPGTDYYAAAAVSEFSKRFGIPGIVVHTHHPVGCDLKGTVPDPDKAPSSLGKDYAAIVPDLIFPTPAKTEQFVMSLLGKAGYSVRAIPAYSKNMKNTPRR